MTLSAPPFDRVESLTRWAEEWAATRTPPPEVVLVRGGDPHAAILSARLPGALVIAWDSGGEEIFARRFVSTARDAFVKTLARRSLTIALEVYRASPAEGVVAPSAPHFDRLLAEARRQALVEQGTLTSLAGTWIRNLDANAPLCARLPSVSRLRGAATGRPVIVVGAGPSLDNALPLLRAAQGRAAIVAATSAARPLARAGLVPDALVIIEGRDCRHHFEGVDEAFLQKCVLVADSSTAPVHLDLPFGARFLFHGGLLSWLAPWSGPGSILPTGGNVGTTAVIVAWLLGGNPIVFAGLDFAVDGARYYASQSGSRTEEHAATKLQDTASWNGGVARATPELTCYREQTEDVLEAIAQRDARTRFLSLARDGARVHGASLATPDEIAATLPPGGVPRPALASRSDRPRRDVAAQELAEEGRRRVDRRLQSLLEDDRGPAIALSMMRPADSLPMIVAAPAIIEAHLAGTRDRDSVRQVVRGALASYDAAVSRILAEIEASPGS